VDPTLESGPVPKAVRDPARSAQVNGSGDESADERVELIVVSLAELDKPPGHVYAPA